MQRRCKNFSKYELVCPSVILREMLVDPSTASAHRHRVNPATLHRPAYTGASEHASDEPQLLVKIVSLPGDPDDTVLGVLLLGIDGSEVSHWPHKDCTTRQQVIEAISADAMEGNFQFEVLK